jgi:hypothetical protein
MRIRRVRMEGYVSVTSGDEWRAEVGPSMAQRQGKWGGRKRRRKRRKEEERMR